MRILKGLATAAVAVVLAACGGSDNDGPVVTKSDARGVLQVDPPQPVAALSAAQFKTQLASSASGQGLLAVAGDPVCGVTFRYLQYGTVGGAGEPTNATGALMVPTGTAAQCTGPRPIVLWAHGTAFDKRYNLADIVDPTNAAYGESSMVAAVFAAQGFIVVAPNYAGYDASALPYHPYLNEDQQSKDMIDALTAARKALPHVGTADSGQLFVSGYSQGGYVAMATHKALQALGQTVTASAPLSGPYALAALVDAVYYGDVNLGSSLFTPMLVTSYQKAYGNVYATPADMYSPQYATGIETLLPSATPISDLIAQGKVPQTAMFDSTPPTSPDPALQALLDSITPPTTPAAEAPLFALGFGASPLINNSTRLAYLVDAIANPDGAVPTPTTGLPAAHPQDPIRQDLVKNDLRDWTPTRPVLLCGGNADPTVFFSVDTGSMQAFWSAPSPAAVASPALLTVLDVDSAAAGATDPFAAIKAGFAQAKAATAQAAVAAGAADGGAAAVITSYHGGLVPPFCSVAARGFFEQVAASGQ